MGKLQDVSQCTLELPLPLTAPRPWQHYTSVHTGEVTLRNSRQAQRSRRQGTRFGRKELVQDKPQVSLWVLTILNHSYSLLFFKKYLKEKDHLLCWLIQNIYSFIQQNIWWKLTVCSAKHLDHVQRRIKVSVFMLFASYLRRLTSSGLLHNKEKNQY